jgi:flagellar motor switch protein FliM
MIVQIPLPFTLLEYQIEKYTELLAQARKTDDIKRRAHLRQQLHLFKLKMQSFLN